MGKKPKKKQQRNIRNNQRAGASKHSPAASSPGSNRSMALVPISSSGITGDDSACAPLSPQVDGAGCPHVERGVKLEKLRTRYLTKPLPQCQGCTRSRPLRAKAGTKNDLWICLACGYIGCGSHTSDAKDATAKFVHANIHRNQWHHPIVMQWGESLQCWCFECETQLMYPAIPVGDSVTTATADEAAAGAASASGPRLLQRAAALLQESISGHPKSILKIESGHAIDVEDDASTPSRKLTDSSGSGSGPVRLSPRRRVIKGLMNLGNTCFFNSVMQNLVSVSMVREHFGKEASAPEGVLKTALRKFFQEMDPTPSDRIDGADGGRTVHTRSIVGNSVSPRGLFSAICTKAPRFKGYQQQDSHELLRCLLDGLHMEEESMRKAQSAAAEEEPAAESNGSVKEEGNPKKAPETFVEHMFGGQLSSTVSCRECGHSSVVYEPFLDLSLPIPSKQERSMAKAELPKQRGQKGDASGSGTLSVKTAGCSPFDSGLVDKKPTAMDDTKETSEAAPVLGCSLGPLSVLDFGADSASAEEKPGPNKTGGKDHADSPATSFPCEIVSSVGAVCSTNTTDGWQDFLDEPSEAISEESAAATGSHAMSFLDQRPESDTLATASGAPDSNQSREVEIDSQQGVSTNQGEEIVENSPEDMFGNELLDDGNQMEEEAIEYGPQLPGAECLDLVLFLPSPPDVATLPSEVKEDQTAPGCLDETLAGDQSNHETSSTSDAKLGAIVPAKLKSQSSDDLEGVGGLFDEEESSYSRNDSASGTNFDLMGIIPAQISGSRAVVPAEGGREVESYPIMSLEGCLQAFMKTELLSGENAWGCENCTRIAHGVREPEPDQSAVSEEAKDTSGLLKQSPEIDEQSSEIETTTSDGTSALNAIHDALDDAETDGMQGEWESLVLEDRVTEQVLSTSTNSLSIVVVPEAKDVSLEMSDQQTGGSSMIESSTNEMVDDERNAGEGTTRTSSVELSTVEDGSSSKSHNNRAGNTLKRSQSQDCFDESAKTAESQPSSSSKEKEGSGIEEPYVMVEASSVNTDPVVEDDTASRSGRRRRNNNVVGDTGKEAKGRAGKLAAKALQNGSKALQDIAKKVEKVAHKMVTVKRDATKRFLISRAPLVLTVHLKRFAQDLHGRLSKLSGHITFHEQLDLGPFIDQRDDVEQKVVYQLIGTVAHSGSMRGGHYVAYVKGPDIVGENDAENSSDPASTWYHISDSLVRKSSLESVLQSEAYLLFYERQTFE